MPPKEVIIRDLVGNVVQGMTGVPYNEGDKVSLFCDATGGKYSHILNANWLVITDLLNKSSETQNTANYDKSQNLKIVVLSFT